MNRDQLIEHLERTHRYLNCNKCNICFKSKQELNTHIIDHHKSHKPCRNYASGSCEYEEAECRFKHIKLQENQQICYNCGVITQTVKDLMNHIKEIHGAQACTKFAAGNCDRKSQCWYSYVRIPATNINNSTPNSEQSFWWFPPPGGNTAQWWEIF